ncbi:A24 family peptidase [Lutibaculum baratangense]|uniref:Type IV prepilin peptidase TadV/CpaA n=1 Tax=Lutibaculum baratangense AMV1 TaxID=631454 RepID=V4RNP3_9HYPH|nr:prepilin peptidase [Lutibaculum baratangense]ESR24825.1 Type IV prepilin peptidase TadV/CpaA [Lutibaculum baratangense AMV1]
MDTSIVLLAFPALMGLAASFDALTMTIPNRISIALVLSFALAAILVGLPAAGVWAHVGAGALALAVGFACFALGWIGGGDAKLAAAAALWIGWSHLLEYALLFSILGGVLTLAILMGRQLPLPQMLCRVGWIDRLHDRNTGIPYGIALAAAALVLFPETGWMSLIPAP